MLCHTADIANFYTIMHKQTCCASAEVYGAGKSEKLLQDFQRTTGTNVKIATKYAPLPWRFGKNAPVKALKV